MSLKFKTIAEVFRGPGKDEGIEALLSAQAKDGYSLIAFTAEPAQFSYRFIFSKVESEKKNYDK